MEGAAKNWPPAGQPSTCHHPDHSAQENIIIEDQVAEAHGDTHRHPMNIVAAVEAVAHPEAVAAMSLAETEVVVTEEGVHTIEVVIEGDIEAVTEVHQTEEDTATVEVAVTVAAVVAIAVVVIR